MTVILSFPPETEQKLRQRAAQAGQSVERYVEQLVESSDANHDAMALKSAAGNKSVRRAT